MRTLLALALLPATLLLPGCPLACGGYDGAGDTVYRSASGNSLMQCENGGYVRASGTTYTEGRWQLDEHGFVGSVGETGALSFTMPITGTTGTIGDETFERVTLDQTELDHAHVQCADLEARTWWAASPDALPVDTVFAKPAAGFISVDACESARAGGLYSATASCELQLRLCANGQVAVRLPAQTATGRYTATVGTILASPAAGASLFSLEGTLSSDGTLRTTSSDVDGQPGTWHQITPAQAAAALPGC